MAAGDFEVMPNNTVKHFKHLLMKIREHCGSFKKTIEFVGIADTTYRKLTETDFVVKSTAQKILNAYSKIAPYNQKTLVQ